MYLLNRIKFLILFLLLSILNVNAIVSPTKEFYVNDYANILSSETEKYIIDGEVQNTQASYSKIDRSKVRQFEIVCDDNLTFRSLRKATDYFGLNHSCNVKIAACCRGELESAYGHTWKYGKEVTKLREVPTVEETL